MSKDMMPHFELYQPDSVEGALDLLGRLGEGALPMAGGNDTLDWLKDRVKRATAVVDLAGIEEMKGIRETADGIEIGALTTLTEIEQSALIQGRYQVLADAAYQAGPPDIHEASVFNIQTFFGWVSTTAQFCEVFDGAN